MDIYTIGHSTRTADEFTAILNSYDIEILIDVRSHPGSRRFPHFGKDAIESWLQIEYIHMSELGGRRKKSHSVDEAWVAGWTHPSFRNYAAYTFTEEYQEGIKKLVELAKIKKAVYMCSEALPWRCHRSIISNTLTAMNINVWHIMDEEKKDMHLLGRYGAKPKIEGNQIIYPGEV